MVCIQKTLSNRPRFITSKGFWRILTIALLAVVPTIVLTFGGCANESKVDDKDLIKKSRDSTVQILVASNKPVGTGFFVDNEHIVTCFHVVAILEQEGQEIRFKMRPNIRVKLINGESIDAECVSIPSQQDKSPLQYDFAVLKLKSNPQMTVLPMPLYDQKTPPEIGDTIYFSGYPLGTPMMLTHRGMISGIGSNLVGIQAPINKGSSGSAVLTANGKVVGIVSYRMGGLNKRLRQIQQHIMEIEKGPKKSTVKISGTDPIESIKELNKTLDRHISTGFGYARTTEHLKEYLKKHGITKD